MTASWWEVEPPDEEPLVEHFVILYAREDGLVDWECLMCPELVPPPEPEKYVQLWARLHAADSADPRAFLWKPLLPVY